ncbi:hypothetical protein D5S17_13925 [Pseudonocardiaceae bacterium YIM PH 21723]|nr:hypothetical protein D5S17_13925 [Pseudonocardiaceae bacterium YIM PH 21723]
MITGRASATPRRRLVSMPALRISPQLTLAVFALAMAWPQNNVIKGPGGSITPARVLAGFCFLWWLVTRLSGGLGLRSGRNPVRGTILLALGLLLLANGIAMANGVADAVISDSDRTMMLLVLLGGTAMLAADALEGVRALRIVLGAMVIGATMSAFSALVMFVTKFDLRQFTVLPGLEAQGILKADLARGGLERALGFATHPIELAAIATAAIPLALHLARHAGYKPLWWACVLVLATGPMVAISRTGLLGMAIIVMLLLPRVRFGPWILGITGAAVVGGVAALSNPKLAGVLDKTVSGSKNDSSIGSRLRAYEYVAELVQRNTFGGQGLGTYKAPPQPYLDNQYLLTLVESGLLGEIALIALLVAPVVLMVRVWRGDGVLTARRAELPATKDAAWAVGTALVTCVVSFGTYDALAFPQFEGFTLLLIGLAGAVVAQTLPDAVARVRPVSHSDVVTTGAVVSPSDRRQVNEVSA